MADRIVPTSPGWWWADFYGNGKPGCVEVVADGTRLAAYAAGDECEDPIENVPRFIAPVATPEQVAALTAERDDLAAELAAARGENIGEWECVVDMYVQRRYKSGVSPALVRHDDGVRWFPCVLDADEDEPFRGEPTGVLAAMRAACEAARGFGWTP